MDNYIFTEVYTSPPFFDWKVAEEEYGAFGAILKDGFESFIHEKFNLELIALRKCYITRDYLGIRFWIHKYKGSFK
jgi:hypothetical protein